MRQFITLKSNTLSAWSSLLLTLLITACGGGSDSGNDLPTIRNVVPVSVDGRVFGSLNAPFVSVTLCSPSNAFNCITIDHILVDTGSVGLRVFAQPKTTAALSTLNLTPQTASGNAIAECLPFAQGVTWGPIRYTSLRIGSKSVDNAAIQVINDPAFTTIPAACSNQGNVMNTPSSFGANGVLGIGLYPQDCGNACTSASPAMNVYFSCTVSGCVNVAQPLVNQIQNPVALFATDNNGIILTLDAISSSGSDSVNGTLTFGVDTETNNASTHTNTILVNNDINNPAAYGYFSTDVNGQNFPASFIDSGSNGYFFNLNSPITPCPSNYAGFYCPASTINLAPVLSGRSGSTAPATVNISIANTASLLSNNNFFAFNNIGGTAINAPGIGSSFDWGLPFFFGRSVFIVMDGRSSNAGAGPYYGW